MKGALAALLFLPAIASAEFITGNKLLSDIRSNEPMERSFAIGYIAGVADAIHSITYCPPAGITLGQLRDMTEQYLNRNSSIRNFSADVLVGDMLTKRWPCSTTPGRGV